MTMFALLGLAFAVPASQKDLDSPQRLTRRLIKQKARHHPLKGSDTLLAHRFRCSFTPLTAVLFTFPSRYLFTIGRQLVFSLTPWSARIHAKFHVCRITQVPPRSSLVFGYGPVTLCGAAFLKLHLTRSNHVGGPTTPGYNPGLGFSAFVRHYRQNRFRFLFLWVLRCFTSPSLTRRDVARGAPQVYPG